MSVDREPNSYNKSVAVGAAGMLAGISLISSSFVDINTAHDEAKERVEARSGVHFTKNQLEVASQNRYNVANSLNALTSSEYWLADRESFVRDVQRVIYSPEADSISLMLKERKQIADEIENNLPEATMVSTYKMVFGGYAALLPGMLLTMVSLTRKYLRPRAAQQTKAVSGA